MALDPSINKTGAAVPSDKPLDIQDDSLVFDTMINDTSGQTVLDRKGVERETYQSAINRINSDANEVIDSYRQRWIGDYVLPNKVFRGKGDFVTWAVGDGGDGNAYVYIGPESGLPYFTDVDLYPDPNSDPNLQLNPTVTALYVQQVANDGDSQLAGGNIWPLSSQESAQDGDNIQAPYESLRDNLNLTHYGFYPYESGVLSNLDIGNGTADIDGNPVELFATNTKLIFNIEGFYQQKGKDIYLKSWHGFVLRNGVKQLSGGGGRFVYNHQRSKLDHNGGTVIDPDIQYTGDVQAYLNASGSGNGVYERVDITETDPCMFGAKASDEVFDDLPSIQAMLNERGIRSFRDSVARLEEIGGKCRFIPYITPYQMSDYAIVYGDTQLDGNNARIKPTGGDTQLACFYVNLRTDQQGPRGFNINMEIVNFRMWSDRGFVSSGSTLDVRYFLFIDGGWIMMSKFGNFAFDIGCSLLSAINWNLEHRNDTGGTLIQEVGVPDGIELFNIKGTDAQNMSFCVSVVGDQLGSGSRLGKVNISNMLKGNQFAKDFNDPTQDTGVSGCIYLFESEMNYNGDGGLDFIFGDIVCRRSDTNKFVGFRSASFGQLYNEIQTNKGWRQAQIRGGVYENCTFNTPIRLFMDRTNALPFEPQVFDATFIDTDLPQVNIRDGSQSGDLLRDNPILDLINLRNDSYNVNMRLPNIERTSETRAFQQRLITAPKWSNIYISEVHRMRQITVNGQDLTAGGDYVLHRVKANTVADLASNLNLQWSIRTQVGATVDIDFYVIAGNTGAPGTPQEYLVGNVNLSNAAANENATFDLIVNAGERFNPTPSYNSRSGRWEAQSTAVSNSTATALNIADMVLNVEQIDLQIVARVNAIGGTATIRATRVQDGYADTWVNWVV